SSFRGFESAVDPVVVRRMYAKLEDQDEGVFRRHCNVHAVADVRWRKSRHADRSLPHWRDEYRTISWEGWTTSWEGRTTHPGKLCLRDGHASSVSARVSAEPLRCLNGMVSNNLQSRFSVLR